MEVGLRTTIWPSQGMKTSDETRCVIYYRLYVRAWPLTIFGGKRPCIIYVTRNTLGVDFLPQLALVSEEVGNVYVMQEDAAEGVVWFTSACMMRMLC